MSDQDHFEKLRQILLEEDQKERLLIKKQVEEIDDQLNSPEKFNAKVEPIVNDRIGFIKDNFPVLFGPLITESIKLQIKESQDEVVEALYPIMGKMIKRYVSKELELLSERIDNQINTIFSWKNWFNLVKGWFGGVNHGEMIVKGLQEPTIEEIFVIEQNSGILLGSYTRNQTIDQDMIAGMLTAIKSFVSDAFTKEQQELEIVEYETYKIFVRNFKSFYVSVVLSGTLNADFKNKLDDLVLNFTDNALNSIKKGGNESSEGAFSGLLTETFKNFESK